MIQSRFDIEANFSRKLAVNTRFYDSGLNILQKDGKMISGRSVNKARSENILEHFFIFFFMFLCLFCLFVFFSFIVSSFLHKNPGRKFDIVLCTVGISLTTEKRSARLLGQYLPVQIVQEHLIVGTIHY